MAFRISGVLIQRADAFRNRCSSGSSRIIAIEKMAARLQAHQQSLPRLPVPPLHASLEKYLLSVRPLLSEEEYRNTEKITNEFGAPGGLGVKLHSLLRERAKVMENWLDEWWLNSAYLEFRMPVVLYSNNGLVLPIKQFASVEKQLRYAACLIAGALDFKKMIDSDSLPLDTAGNDPLDMSQYYKIFSTCRIPHIPKDHLNFYGMEADKPKHIVVAHNNHYFCVDVYGSDGKPLNESQLLSQLESVLEQSQFPKDPIGVLTTQHRDNWAEAYKHLIKFNNKNKESVETIQKAIFLLCLDKAVPESNINRKTHVALQTIHGGGAKHNAGNRWYDKTIQFIVGEDGVAGLTFEHSPGEGAPITSMIDHIISYMEKTKDNKWLPSTAVSKPQKLRFKLSDETMQHISKAEQDLENLVNDLEMSCFTYEPYGKNFIKSQKMSPDSFIQVAIQLAYYRLYNQVAATYESATFRKFLHGRTETIRSASIETLDFCKIMMDNTSSKTAKLAAMRNAIDAHKKYALQAVNGMAIDRLLLGLKKVALESGMNVPEIFLDTGYTTSTHFKLSTSQVPSKVDAFMCFGPLVPDGYGCCYNPLPFGINFGLSASNSSPETYSGKFMEALIDSLTEMHDLIIQTQKAKLFNYLHAVHLF